MTYHQFIEDPEATYDDIALELMGLEDGVIEDILQMVFMHSNVEALEKYEIYIQNTYDQYEDLKRWRREAGLGD